MSGWTLFWLAMAAIFTIADITAAANQQKGDTFTEHLQAWWGSGKPPS